MEDQQPGSGDLTEQDPDDATAEADEADEADEPDQADPADETDESGTGDAAAAQPDEAAAPAERRTGRRLAAVGATVAAALLVGSAAFAGAVAHGYLTDRAETATKLRIVETAVEAINTLWNYTPESMETLGDRASKYLSGDLAADYRRFIDAIVTVNKQAKVTDDTEIVGAAVESLRGDEASVIIYTNTTASSELTKAMPALKYQSHALAMRRDHGRWLITKMPTITSFSLTPQL